MPVSVTPDVAELKGSDEVLGDVRAAPCQLDDPLERLMAIHGGQAKGAKEEHKALGATTLQNWAEHATPNVFAARGEAALHRHEAGRPPSAGGQPGRSNVPRTGLPALPGRGQLLGMFPLGPVMDGIGLNITIMSYRECSTGGFASEIRRCRAPPVGHHSHRSPCAGPS